LRLGDGDASNRHLLRLLRDGAGEMGIPLDEWQLRLFAAYEEEILTWNRLVSLVAVKSPRDIPVKHFLDSLTALPFLPQEDGLLLLDIGTGGGFPGLPLKIARPDIALYLLETSRKKVSFLKETIRKLGLKGVTVIHDRVEKLMAAGIMAAAGDAVISRASFQVPALLGMGRHFLRPGGRLIVMRGPREQESDATMEQMARRAGFVLEKKEELHLPITGEARKILRYQRL